jgi:hypothetical protein
VIEVTEQERTAGTGARKTWLFLAGMLIVYLVWVLIAWSAIGEKGRQWRYGSRPSIPADSPVSSEAVTPPAGAPQAGLAPSPTATGDTTPRLLREQPPPLEVRP